MGKGRKGRASRVAQGEDVVTHFLFFFQAEDGIRDYKVTGVQTCALPIFEPDLVLEGAVEIDRAHHHLRQRERAPELSDEAGRVECRSARQLGTIDEQDVPDRKSVV